MLINDTGKDAVWRHHPTQYTIHIPWDFMYW